MNTPPESEAVKGGAARLDLAAPYVFCIITNMGPVAERFADADSLLSYVSGYCKSVDGRRRLAPLIVSKREIRVVH